MGIYGVDIYGQTRFGRDPDLIRPDFDVSPFQSTPLDYSTLHLTWQRPNSTDCTYLRLVRNSLNLPQDEDDGVYLWGDNTTTPPFSETVLRPTNFTDGQLSGGFYYYTMWGWSNKDQDWVRCTDLIALVPINWGYGSRLYSLLPLAYRDLDILLVDPYNPWPVTAQPVPTEYVVNAGDTLASVATQFGTTINVLSLMNGVSTDVDLTPGQVIYVPGPSGIPPTALPPLQRYLNLLGFEMDFIRTELESLMSVNDPRNCSGALLPLLAQELGLQSEPEIGMQQERTFIFNAIHLYKLKGSPRGISEFCSILTSYPMGTLTHHGYNVLLCRDDSIAETSIGTWQAWPPGYTHFTFSPAVVNAAGLTLTQIPNLLSGSIANMTNPVETYPGGLPPALNPPYNSSDPDSIPPSGMRITATAVGDRWITTGRVPITDFMSTTYGAGYITWRIQIWSSVSRQVRLSLWGDPGNGVAVPIFAETSFTETAGHWTLMTVTAPINPYPNGTGSPAAFYWVFPVIHIVGAAANEAHYVTLMGLWACTPGDIGVNTPIYDYPRDVKVILSPQAANLLSNTLTNFTEGFDGLSAAVDPTLPSSNFTCSLAIQYVDPEDPASLYTVNGTASLQVTANAPNATVWFGLVNSWTQPLPTKPQGWFANALYGNWGSTDAGDWFPGEMSTFPDRAWFDPTNGWFTMNNNYFTLATQVTEGNWFPPLPQPPQNGNLLPFAVQPNQAFNFSVYADYLSVMDPSNAVMQIGFRWYYADGTWTESYPDGDPTYVTAPLNDVLTRYSCPPADPSLVWMAYPPPEAPTSPNPGAQPVSMYPFVRFPYAQQSVFLLNSAMLSPGQSLPNFMDITMFPGNSDYLEDSHGGTYYYRRRQARVLRLEQELYRWIPMGASHTEVYGTGASLAPLDPTAWPHPAVTLHGNSGMTITPWDSPLVALEGDTSVTATPS